MKHFVWHVRWCSPWVPVAVEHWAGTVHYIWCFSPGVPQNLRILPVASKGFADWNQETGTKRYLWPWDAFSGLLVRPKCTCGQGTCSPRGPIAGGKGVTARYPRTHPPLSAIGLEFWPFGVQSAPKINLWLSSRIPWAIKIAAKVSASKNRLKNISLYW